MIEGTATIPLKEYHRLLKLDETLKRFRKEKDAILLNSLEYRGIMLREEWAIMRPNEVIKTLSETVEKLQAQVKDAKAQLEAKRSPGIIWEQTPRSKKWFHFFKLTV